MTVLAFKPQPDNPRDYEAEADHAKWPMGGTSVELEVIGCAACRDDDVDVRRVGCEEKDGGRAASCTAERRTCQRQAEQTVRQIVQAP